MPISTVCRDLSATLRFELLLARSLPRSEWERTPLRGATEGMPGTGRGAPGRAFAQERGNEETRGQEPCRETGRSARLFDPCQCLSVGQGLVETVEGKASRHQAIARGGRAVAEGTAQAFAVERSP